MKLRNLKNVLLLCFCIAAGISSTALAQEKFEADLCEAANTSRVVEMVYDKDESKGCDARNIDVHIVARGKNGLYMRGYQNKGCAKKNDRPAMRTFRFDKMKSVKLVDGSFSDISIEKKQEGWDGCLGNNCFIDEMLCQ